MLAGGRLTPTSSAASGLPAIASVSASMGCQDVRLSTSSLTAGRSESTVSLFSLALRSSCDDSGVLSSCPSCRCEADYPRLARTNLVRGQYRRHEYKERPASP
jgi:hypothetical protein